MTSTTRIPRVSRKSGADASGVSAAFRMGFRRVLSLSKLSSSSSNWTDENDLRNAGFTQIEDTTAFVETITDHNISGKNYTTFSRADNTRIWSADSGDTTFCEIRQLKSVDTIHAMWLIVHSLITDDTVFKARKALTEDPNLEDPFVNQSLVTADTASFSRKSDRFQGGIHIAGTRIRGGMNRYEKQLRIHMRGLNELETTAPGFFATALNSSTEPY